MLPNSVPESANPGPTSAGLARTPGPSWGRVADLLLRLVLPLALVWLLASGALRNLSVADLRQLVAGSQPGYLLLGLTVYVIANALRAVRMVVLLDRAGVGIRRMLSAMFALSMFNNLLPMRSGELSFPYMMRQDGVEYGSSLAALLVSRLLDLWSVSVLFVAAAVVRIGLSGATSLAPFGVALGSAVLVLGVVVLITARAPALVQLLSTALGKWVRIPQSMRAPLERQLSLAALALHGMQSSGRYAAALLLSLAAWTATYAWFDAFLTGIGMPTAFATTVFGGSFAALAKSLPISTFGGFGAHEAGWTIGFTLAGQALETAILGGFAVNVLTLLSSLLLGLIALGGRVAATGGSLRSYLNGLLGTGSPSRATRQPASSLGHRRVLLCILVAFLALGVVYSVVTPLFETPDEVWHYLYVKWIADGHGLPVYQEGASFPMEQEASQPPLYYLINGWATTWIPTSDAEQLVRYNPHAAIGAPSAWANRNVTAHTPLEAWPYRGTSLAAHFCRLLSVLMGAATVALTYDITRRLFPTIAWLPAAAAGVNAFLPQFVFIESSVNNDVLVTLLAAFSLWLLVRIVQEGASCGRLVTLGVGLGLAALSKLNGLVLLPLVAVVLLVHGLAGERRLYVLRSWLLVFSAAFAVGGWWYLRNWILYGSPLGLNLMFAVLPQRPERPGFSELLLLMDGALNSLFGVFGWFNVVMEPWLYTAFRLVTFAAAGGLLWLLLTALRQKDRRVLLRMGLLACWSLAFVLALVGWAQARFPQGRLLFPAISALSTLGVLGLAAWVPGGYRARLALVLVLLLAALTAVVPFRYIAPAYAAEPRPSDDEVRLIADPMLVEFSGLIRLLGYDLSDVTICPGSRVWLTLYWQGIAKMDRDYSVFVHLVDGRGVTIAQRDSYPSGGNDPTRSWTPGQIRLDTYPLDIPEALLAEGPFRIHVGWYDYASQQRLTIERSGGVWTDHVVLPRALRLPEQTLPELIEVRLRFGEQIVLSGYQVSDLSAAPGDRLAVVLRWEALQSLSTDYTVFAQLLRAGAEIWGQNDHVPMGGQSPTSSWAKGLRVTDRFDVDVSPDAPPDVYDLTVGLYDPKTMKRLPLPEGRDFVVLAKVAVRPTER